MNVTKHLLASLRNTVLERLPPISHDVFYGFPNKNNPDQASASTKKKRNVVYMREKFQLSRQGKRKAEEEGSAVGDTKQNTEVDTPPVKKGKYKTKSQTHAVVESAVEQEVQITTRGKKAKSPIKLEAVDETKNVWQNVQNTTRRGRKRKIPLKFAEIDATNVEQDVQITTQREKGKTPIKLEAVDETNVWQNVQNTTRRGRKKKIPLKFAEIDATNVEKNVQITTRGRKKRSQFKSAVDIGQNVQISTRANTKKFPLKLEAVTGVGQNAEVGKGKKQKTPIKTTKVVIFDFGQSHGQIFTRGRKKKYPLESAEVDVKQNTETENVKQSKSPLNSAAVDVKQNTETEKVKQSKSPLNSAAVDETNVEQKVKISTRRGRKKKISLKPAKIDVTGAVQSVQILTPESKIKSVLKTVVKIGQNAEAEKEKKKKSSPKTVTFDLDMNSEAEKEKKKKSPPKTVTFDLDMNAEAEKEKKKKSPPKTVTFDLDMLNQLNAKAGKDKVKKKSPLKTAVVNTTTKRNKRQSCQIKSENIVSPSQWPLKKQTGTASPNPARIRFFIKREVNINGGGKTAGRGLKSAVPYKKIKLGKSGQIMDTKMSAIIHKIKTEVADLEEQGEKIVSPSTKKMPKVSEVPTTVNTVTSKKSGVQKLSWDFSIPAVSAKESLVKGYKLRNRMAKQIIVTSTAPKVLRKEKSGANFVATFIKKEPEEVNADDEIEEQGSAGLERNDTETSEVGCNTEERQIEEQPKVAFENNQELPECSVNLIDCVKSSVVKTHDQAGYQLRQRPPKDPLKPKKYKFKKLPPELKPEPLIDYEFEVTDEVDALSLDEIVIPDSLPYEFEPLAVSMASSSHHEDIYEAAPIASSSHYTESSGLAEASNLEVKPVTPVKRTYMKKKIQPPSQVYNLRKKKNQQLPEDKQVEKMSQIFDYDILNTRVVLKKMPGKNYWS